MENKKGKKKRRLFWPFRLFLWLLLIMSLGTAGGLGYFQFAPPEKTCLSCHEIHDAYDRWSVSSHRDVDCKACHGGSLTTGIHGLVENAQRVVGHFQAESRTDIRLDEEQVVRMQDACRACHASEFAAWQQGGHAATYADIYLDETHNRTEQLSNDCLRCHGMFFAGRIDDLVTPVDTQGPWRLVEARRQLWPTIPCLACHEVHRDSPRLADRAEGSPEALVDAVSFYHRYEKEHFSTHILPDPRLTWQGQPVRLSSDRRQRVCIQCHAPESSEHAGTSDDKTPRGVHEGVSCLACHHPHTNDATASCATCHPVISNCGIDVTTMDTSFASAQSGHDIHFVACGDCHTDGVPRKP